MMSDAYISKEKELKLAALMERLGIKECDLTEKFILGSGKGGQKVNKTSSCVYLRHEKSGIELKCQSTRSRALNRYHARRELCERLKERISGEKSERQQAREKIRRSKRRRSRRQKNRMLDQKRMQGDKKKSRRAVSHEED